MNVYAGDNKKMLNMLILEILKEYTDAEHRLTQQKIIDLLKLNYGAECDRRSIRNNICSLQDMGYEIATERGCYLAERDFDDAELRMLIDSVLFSKNLSGTQAKRLIEKLKGFGNRYFHAKVSHVSNLPELFHSDNKQVMLALDVLNDAIEEKRKVSFIYNCYGTDFKLHPRRNEPYIVNPYQMVANNGRYYLIGNYDKYDDLSHYRIDRITSITMLSEPVKSKKEVREFSKGWSLPKHMAEHIYMYSGDSVTVKFIADTDLMDELIDWFGRDIRIKEESENKMLVTLKCNERAMKYWALQYGGHIEIKEPQSLRETVKVAILDQEDRLLFSDYERHFANIQETLSSLLQKAYDALGDFAVAPMITGSGGLTLAKHLGVPFVQEVIAVSTALQHYAPQTDVAIELGGEDAKIIYFEGGNVEQRMNGICAGGTGSFIDQMASLIQTDATGLNEYAKNYKAIYPIAARCGVFAKTDIQPLINEGATREDLSASIFQAVVNQTISGLACGKPIRGHVAFLGGPLHFLSELKAAFIRTLN